LINKYISQAVITLPVYKMSLETENIIEVDQRLCDLEENGFAFVVKSLSS